MVIKKLLKAAVVVGTTALMAAGATGAYFTSATTVSGNVISAGTLRVAVDSTLTHTSGPNTWGFPNAFTASEDLNGVTTQYYALETWANAAPGSYIPYVNTAGADVLPDGNHSYWVALRNSGTIPSKVRADVSGGTWVMNPAVAATLACSGVDLNASSVVTVNNVTLYGTTGGANICKSHEECENIYYGEVAAGRSYSSDTDISGSDINVTPTGAVYGTADGTSTGAEIALQPNEFMIARVDANFNTSNNCYQGATYTYNLNGNAFQIADMTW